MIIITSGRETTNLVATRMACQNFTPTIYQGTQIVMGIHVTKYVHICILEYAMHGAELYLYFFEVLQALCNIMNWPHALASEQHAAKPNG